ncbi:MAG: hypothetical protein L0Z54_03020, partial [Thermoplasmata archaeon]|nr:hypothetical protein [Thermoplasmata archaeon]
GLDTPNGAPGENVTLTFQVSNDGNYVDNFTLASGARDSAFRNWTTISGGRTPDIGAYSSSFIGVIVGIPRSSAGDIIAANTYSDVWLTARSAWNPVVETTGFSRIRVSESRDVDITTVGNDTIEVISGETAVFTLEVTNVANFDSDDIFDLTLWTDQTDWITVIQPNNLSLQNGESARVKVKATPPDFTDFRRCELTMTATSRADPSRSRSVDVVALLPQRYGVEVTTLPPVHQEGGPLDVVQYGFEVENQGNDADVISFYAWTDWGMTTDVPPLLSIPFRGLAQVYVNVTVSGIEAGEVENVHLRARAGDGLAEDEASATLEVLQGYAVSIEPGTNVTEADPGGTVLMNFVVTNLGNGNDEYDVRVVSNYSAHHDPGSPVDLRAGEMVTLRLEVDVPSDADAGTMEATHINVTSRNDPAASAESSALINVAQVAGVLVENAAAASGDPGGMTTLNFTVQNVGNGVDSFSLDVTSQRDWALTIVNPGATALVEADEARFVQVRVLIPHDLEAGTADLITLRATSDHSKDIHDEGNGVCRVNLVTGVSVLSREARTLVIPGRTIRVPVYVENTGNGQEFVNVVATSAEGWYVDTDKGMLSLERSESEPVEVSISAPMGSYGDTSTIVFTATVILENATGDFDTEYLFAESSFAMPSDLAFVYIFPGQTRTFGFRVENIFQQSSTLNVTYDSPGEWAITISAAQGAISPGESATVVATVTAPANLLHLYYPTVVPVTFDLVSTGQVTTVDMTLVGLSPDLSIDGIDLKRDVGEGQTLMISFDVRSTASPTGDPDYDTLRDVPVEVYLDGDLVHVETIDVPIDGLVPVSMRVEMPDLDWWLRYEVTMIDVKIASRDYESQNTLNDNVQSRTIHVRKNPHPAALLVIPIAAIGALVGLGINRRKVRLRQRLYEHVFVGVLFASVLTALLTLPFAAYPLDVSGEALAYFMILALTPVFCMVTGLRTKSYVAVAILAVLMFGLFFIAMASGHGAWGIIEDAVANVGVLPLPAFMFLLLPLVAGMVAAMLMLRLIGSAVTAYEQARAFVDAVKKEAR